MSKTATGIQHPGDLVEKIRRALSVRYIDFWERRIIDSGVEQCSVVTMQMPPTPDQHRFYTGLLFELGAPHNPAAGLASLERLTRDILRRVAPRVLIVDEVHHLLAGTYREQRASLNLLKYLANDLQISMVLVGTRDAVLALQTDAQMYSRYRPFEIPRWRESDSLRRLLAAFERVLPLRKPSDLTRREIVQFVLGASGGLTGKISTLLNDAAEFSIRSGDETLDCHVSSMSRETLSDAVLPWPVAPRPFFEEAFGGWLGRVAARYQITVRMLWESSVQTALPTLGTAGWILFPTLDESTLERLSRLARLNDGRLKYVGSRGRARQRATRRCY